MRILIFFVFTIFWTQALSSYGQTRKRLKIIGDSLEIGLSYKETLRLCQEVEKLTKEKQDDPELAYNYYKYVIHIAYIRMNGLEDSKIIIDYTLRALKELNNVDFPQKDSLKTELQILEASCYSKLRNYEKSEELYLKIIENKPKFQKHKASAYNGIAIINFRKKNYRKAKLNINQAIKAAKNTQDTTIIVDNYITKSNILISDKNYIEAVMTLDTASQMSSGSNYYYESTIYSKKAIIYLIINDYKKAISLNKKGLEIMKLNGIYPINEAYFNLDLAEIYLKNKNYDSCFIHSNKVLKLKLKNNKNLKLHAYLYISQYFFHTNNLDSLKHYLNLSQSILNQKNKQSLKNKYNQAMLHYFYATMYQKENKLNLAEIYLDSCFRHDFEKGNEYFVSHKEMYLNASTIKKEVKKHEESAYYLDKAILLSEKINKNKINSLITRQKLEDVFKKEKTKLLIKEKEKAKFFAIAFLLFFFVIAILILFFSLKFRTVKIKNKLLQMNSKFTQTQIAPHFIANALSNIQSKILENKKGEANELISDFSELSNLLLVSIREKSISLSQEIELISRYVYFQQLRKDTFDYEMKTPENIDLEGIMILPLVSQPFIENAIEHGLFKKKERGFLKISYTIHDSFFKIEIEDDGIGMSG